MGGEDDDDDNNDGFILLKIEVYHLAKHPYM